MTQKERRQLEEQIAFQCAPLVAGLKLSNLLIVPAIAEESLKHILLGTKFTYYCLCKHGGKQVYLIYRISELTRYLSEPETQNLLSELGYGKCGLYPLLESVAEKYEKHLNKDAEFPHELGLLLGYPVVDVRGFMEQEGKNFLYSGYWKVYGNLKETLQLFQEFGKARGFVVRLISEGCTIAEVADLYYRSRQHRLAVG